MTTALIDVLIPAFNAEKTIRSAVATIQDQTIRDIRIIVVDDGSTDRTAEIVAEMAQADPRVELHRRPNGGIVDALNFGLGLCTAPYLARQDGDDLAVPERFERQIAYLQAHPACVAVGSHARHIDADGTHTRHIARIKPPEDADPFWFPAKEPYIMHSLLMTYLERVRQAGGYRYAYHSEDTDLYWRLRELGTLHNIPDVLGDMRLHAHSVSSRSIVNGRVSALNSQLATLSALRRRDGKPDLAFRKDAIQAYNRTTTLDELFRLGCEQLTPAEAEHLEAALAAKVLDLTSYRPFELDLEDCRFIRRALGRAMPGMAAENRRMLRRMIAGAAARLATSGRQLEARALVEPGSYPLFLYRWAFRAALPRGLRQRILASVGRVDAAYLYR